MKLASSLAMTATGMLGEIWSSDTQWWLSFSSLPSLACSARRMNMRGVNHTGTKRKAITERIVEAKNATTIHLTVFLINLSISMLIS